LNVVWSKREGKQQIALILFEKERKRAYSD